MGRARRARRCRRHRAVAVERRAGRLPERPQDRTRPRAGDARPRGRPADPHGRRQLRRRLVRARRRHDDGDPARRSLQRLLRDGVDARRRGNRDADRLRLQRRTTSRRARPVGRRRRRRDAGHPAARCHQAGEQAGHRRPRPVRHGPVPVDHRLDAERREPRQGSQPVPRPARRAGRQRRRHPRRRSDQPAGVHGHRRRRRGAGGAAQRAHRRRRAVEVRPLQLLGPPGEHGVDRQRRPRRLRQLHGHRLSGAPAAARARGSRPRSSPTSTTASSSTWSTDCTRASTR